MDKNFTRWIYILLSVGIAVLAILGVTSSYYFQKNSIENNSKHNLSQYHERFNAYIDDEAKMMKSLLNLIKDKPTLQSSFSKSNKDDLFKQSNIIFKELNKNNDITHFYFIDTTGKVMLRVHDFKRDSDIVKRYTYLKAKEINNTFYGIEFGLKKNYTLRVVSPWIVNGELLGYIELGKEVDKIIETLSSQLQMEIYFAVSKNEYKNSAQFIQDRLKTLMQTKNHYIVYQTTKSNQKIIDLLENKKDTQWITIEDKNYIGYMDTLQDVSQKKLGEVLFLVDVSKAYDELISSLKYYNTLMIIATLFMLLVGYFVARKKQQDLDSALLKLKNEKLKVQTALNETNNLLSLFDKGDSVLFKWNNDENWSIDYVSSNVKNLLGYTKDDFLTSAVTYADCIFKEDIDSVSKEVEEGKKAKSGFFKHDPYRIITKDGDIKWVLDYTVLGKDIDGNITHFLGYIIDITEREEIHRNLQKFIDTQDNIVILTDGKTSDFANKQFFDFLGYDNLEQFQIKHRCICEFFIENDRFFHLGKINEDENWVHVMQTLPHSQRVVSMLGNDFQIHAFSVTINEFDKDILIVSFTDISQTILESIKLQEKTIHDKLTNAYNREYFEQNYKKLIDKFEQSNHLLGLALLDIDHFKIVNDTYGHDVGDYVLKHFVDIVHKFSRDDDVFIRWGGEEFILVLKVKSVESLETALEHLRKVIEQEKFETIGHKTCSIGATIYKDGEDIDKTIKRADTAVYEAKDSGRNKVIIIE